jgi:Na+-driven multidrug efflux pump
MGGQGPVRDAAVRFARVVFGGAAITFTGGMLDCVLRGEGNVRVPSLWSSAALAVQVVLTPVCMFALHLGLVGAAVAFVAAQAVAIVPRLRFVLGGRGVVTPRAFPRRVAAAPLLEILRVGVPASLSTIVNYLGLMVLTGVVARLGTAHLAAYGLGTRFDFLLMSVAYGFAAAVLTLTGLATGAGHPERARIYVRLAGLCIVLIVAVPSAALVWDPTLWIGLFSHDPDIVAVGTRYFRTIGPSYPFVGVSMVLAFAFQGLGRATLPLVWMVARVTLVLAASIVCTQRLGLGDQAIFTAMAAGNVVSSLAMATLFVVVERRLRRA